MSDFSRYFYDSSALVKLYVEEPGSARALDILESSSAGEIVISRLAPVEVASALVRRSRQGDFGEEQLTTALGLLDSDVERRCQVVEVGGATMLRAMTLVRCYALRAADAIHLACALLVRRNAGEAESFAIVSSDRELNAAAQAEGLSVIDPSQA
ncbi:MAG: type II toxin-antitoxin system VapC family toxin [Phycisphaerae bacterium]